MVPSTVPAAVTAAAERFGESEAVVDGSTRIGFTGLRERVRSLAQVLLDAGVLPGQRVAICAPNTWHWVVAALGTLYAGATLVPVSTRFTGHEVRDVLERTNARALVVDTGFLGRDRLADLHAAGGSVPFVLPTGDWTDLPRARAEVDRHAAEVRPEDVSDVLFTSGTTGRSKGAMSAHRQALAVAEAWAECGRLRETDRYLVINPFFHSFGYKAGILACLLRGATIVPQAVFDLDRTAALITSERITVLPGPPTVYQQLLDRDGLDLSSLRLAVTGAATVPVPLVERMQRHFECVLTAYGLTEAVVATMCRPEDDARTVATTSGRPTAGFELATDPVTGEILLRGSNVMLGYLDDPAATAQAVDSAGWLHTGDIGRVDERGYLTITDRLKDMYICGGFNVYPAEVEQELAGLPGIAESAVIGVPDGRLGEVGKALVITAPGHQLSTEDVLAHCRERLANYKVPRFVEFRSELPRTPAGKVLKRVLREEQP
ncbi:FadD3 family acyl-CoA ligase [Kutzneria viridogrisea]|uniref:Acyl-CoA synthetase (AMP-forming)/AMP-acid ligase II n=1 Tax=Kutzneria viridogrisea TaxID=47990 RepID=A0ABR6BAP5_9PSEU|nr:acyl-CoA synthetase (AMP-forming)/AMP-acid ligase II [Kutzneria viridogrisea]